jgi:HSP20 family molecular chaperone IbpA
MDRDARNWMWAEACEMLARAERLHREFVRPAGLVARLPTWEPPVDILETELEVLVLVALPGVRPDRVEATIDGNDLVITGTRVQMSCAPQLSIGLSSRKAASNAACGFRPGATARFAGPRPTAAF